MRVLAGLGVCLVCASSLVTREGMAQAHGVSLRWNAPEECPDDASLLAAVENNLGEPLTQAPEQTLAVSASVVGRLGGFSAKIRFQSPAGVEERYLEHPECQKLMSGVALLMALAIDPERMKAREQQAVQDAAPAPVSPAEPAPTAPPPVVASPAPGQSAARHKPPDVVAENAGKPLRVVVGAFGFAGVGAVPSVGPGVGIELGLRRERFQLSVLGRYWLPRVASVPSSQNADIELSLAAFGARACGLPWLGKLRIGLCGGADVGDLSGTGHGLDHARTRNARFSQLAAGVFAAYGAGGLAPFAALEGGWALDRPAFGISADGQPTQAFRPSLASFSASLGLSYAL